MPATIPLLGVLAPLLRDFEIKKGRALGLAGTRELARVRLAIAIDQLEDERTARHGDSGERRGAEHACTEVDRRPGPRVDRQASKARVAWRARACGGRCGF